MTVTAYQMLFTDQNANREFVIQPYTRNGPSTPTTSVDPSAATANTTLFLYGKGTPDYGERIQENMIFMMEHFNNPTEPSFPIPGQIWSNTSTNPPQLYVYNPFKYTIVSNNMNIIAIQSTGSLDSLSTILARFVSLGTTKSFTVYSPSFVPFTFIQQTTPGYPQISGGMVLLSVTPVTPLSSMTGYTTGGWEDIWQGNCVNRLRTTFDANGQFIQNIPTPILSSDVVNKGYVDAAVLGGSTSLASLTDVQLSGPGNNNILAYSSGISKWINTTSAALGLLSLSGDTMTGPLILNGDPIANLGAATKQYVDGQLLSNAFTSIITPVNDNLLVYDTGLLKWVNKTATAAGVLALSGGTMTGTLNMGSHILTALTTPINPTDAATKGYVDAIIVSAGGITSAIFDNTAGILTINQNASPTTITIPNFLPSPNNKLQASYVYYTPPDPSSLIAPGLFFQSTLSDIGTTSPTDIQDPTNVQVSAAFRAVDVALGNFTVPRSRLIMNGTGTNVIFNINTGSPNTLVGGSPNLKYVVGSRALAIYINGLKQIAADRGIFKLTSAVTTTGIAGIVFNTGTSSLVVPGSYMGMLHPGTQFTITGTSTANDGHYTVISSSLTGPNTTVVTTPNYFSPTPGTSIFVASGTGTLTYGPFGIMPSMQTGYTFGGPSNVGSLTVGVNGNPAVTLSIDTSTINCDTFGLLADAVNAYAGSFYMNNIVGVITGASGTFTVPGNRTAYFSPGIVFTVRYSSGADGVYTVASSTFGGTNTNIVVTGVIPLTTITGIIFQDIWGYTMVIENGSIVFYSNVSGATSSIAAVSGSLLTSITGGDWPISIPSISGVTNSFACQDYGYKEIGSNGYLSSLIEFVIAPQGPTPGPADIIEFIIDRDIIYNNINPTLLAVTA